MNLENTILICIVAFIAIVLIILLIVSLKRKSKIEIHRKRYMIAPVVSLEKKQYNEIVNKIRSIDKHSFNAVENTNNSFNWFNALFVVLAVVTFTILYCGVMFVATDLECNFENVLGVINSNILVGIIVPLSVGLVVVFKKNKKKVK
ncbi:MAG: hypothetical protein R3Y05_06345 [bacterium]